MESLLAAIWASAALATPLIAEPLLSRDVVTCPPTYTTKNGLNFTSYCEKNNPGNDALPPFLVSSMQECMEHCSRYWGDGEGCFGVVWREDQNCWLRTSNTTSSNMIDDKGIHAALVVEGEMDPLDTKCPETDLSIHTLDGSPGIGYTVHCGKVVTGFDTCWSGYPSCLDAPYIGFYHATSLEDCLQNCVKEHPLCRGVTYNPSLKIGFANCWPKTGFGNTLQNPDTTMGVSHSATITSLDRIDSTCPSDKTYDASGNKAFDIQCGKVNAGTNITSVHMQNVTSCMDLCASSNNGCVGVVFDTSLASGYENCYLQNTTSVMSDLASGTYALLTGSSIPKSSSTNVPASGTTEKKSSKAWIAGPVIGVILGIALIAGAILFFRRRKAKSAVAVAGGGFAEKGAEGSYAHQQAPPGYGHVGYTGAPPPMQQHGSYGAPSELGGSNVTELATGEYNQSAKYAHHGAGTKAKQEPQELA
ncbi:hypothetical protein K505DRAFT_351576 [Melanomma pulvis-pyrius CBS 109.77]|uniref:Apple domain-containing protein n=1 Tax=Melanomma pulvis-pyrius CBS 109.77 TaxID=1314802 RepID=A0A6A6X4I9_9PLEO|nr:hypothetical protein K505DRAFT_351576 [Melanomma pulvis-pyrius CBS 109.77]